MLIVGGATARVEDPGRPEAWMTVHRSPIDRLQLLGGTRAARGARAAAATFVALAAVSLMPPADAQVDAVLTLEDDTVTLSATDDGGLTGTMAVTNVSQDPLGVRLVGTADLASCVFEADPADVPSARTVDVTFTADACTVPANGAQAVVLLDGADVDEVPVTVKVDSAEAADLSSTPVTFGLALVLAGATVLSVARRRPEVPAPQTPDAVGGPGQLVRAPWTFELHGLGVDWGLSSWASNVTVVATTFAAFLGATDILTVVLGTEPKAAVAQILVGGAVALLLLGAAPVLLGLIGPTETPTVAGLLLAAVVTLTGAVGQVLAIAWALAGAGLPVSLAVVAAGLTLASVFLLLYYGHRTLLFRLREGVVPPSGSPAPDILTAAAILLPRLRPDVTPETWHDALWAIAEAMSRAPTPVTDYPSERSLGRRRWTSTGDDHVTGVL